MNETLVTVVGNVATEPESQVTATGLIVTRFRLATTSRRWDAERGAWTDGATSFYTVRAWRSLGSNVKESVCLGEPLVVQGRLRIRQDEKDGKRYLGAELEAVAIGHDLARGVARFTRSVGGGGSGAAARPEVRPAQPELTAAVP
ncbi:single-strand DNA-binding protein [Actinacidiphila yanglinensis]|uniref:Single-stranded DNA-binding protein n=1 Tax=Actinacidiphila yanglinensis TaxID=310779 RepID=A0A1H6D569_9ACTN|nr:single-stranded DNA-binding protein [Actinacidiphila yanglinensis]SEG79943.1 single-strand DNA-binding protein [Actinacidiphila yanglinensis]